LPAASEHVILSAAGAKDLLLHCQIRPIAPGSSTAGPSLRARTARSAQDDSVAALLSKKKKGRKKDVT